MRRPEFDYGKLLQVIWFLVVACLSGLCSVCLSETVYGAGAKAPVISAETPRSVRNLIVFDRAWELVNMRFYDANFNGVDWSAMKQKYRGDAVKALDDPELYQTINRMLKELKVSHLWANPAEAEKEKREHISVSASGLFTLDFDNGTSLVWDVFPGSSAAAAGVRRGWLDKTDYNAIDKNALEYGSLIHCTFLDETDEKRELDLKLTRFSFDGVRESRELVGGILYLRFDRFQPEAAEFIAEQLAAHRSARGAILDLRFNQGGNLAVLQKIAALFLPKAASLGVNINRNEGRASLLVDKAGFGYSFQGPLVVMVGDFTGSAAEVMAAAVQHHRRGVVLGSSSHTSGRVLGSRNFELPDGGSLKVAILNVLSCSGQSLEGVGMVPDMVEEAFTLVDLRAGMDTQLKAALAALENHAKKR